MDNYYQIREKVHRFLLEHDLTLRVVHPLTGVPNRLRKEFWGLLDATEKKRLYDAIEYFQENKS